MPKLNRFLVAIDETEASMRAVEYLADTVAGLPGPARIINQAKSTLFCKSDPTVQYMPGVGGCP